MGLDLDAVAVLDALPGLVGLREQHAGVQRDDARLRLDPEDEVDDDARLLLERTGDREPGVVLGHGVLEHLGGVERLEVRCGRCTRHG
jgi:hypothetical protein